MLDIGWTELLVIAVILIVVVGPKDLPPMIRAFGKMTKRLRRTAGEFRAQFDEALREAELEDLKKSVDDVRSLNPTNSIREALNPLRQMGQEIKSDLERSTRPDAKSTSSGDADQENSILPDIPLGLGEPPEELKPVAQQPVASTPAAPSAASSAAVPQNAPAATVPPVAATAPATSAPTTVASVAEKKTVNRKPAAKAATPAKSAAKFAAAAPTVADAPKAGKATPAKPKTVAVKTAPAKAKAAAAGEAPSKAAAKPRKTKSEDRA